MSTAEIFEALVAVCWALALIVSFASGVIATVLLQGDVQQERRRWLLGFHNLKAALSLDGPADMADAVRVVESLVRVCRAADAVDRQEDFGANTLCASCRAAEPDEHDRAWADLGEALAHWRSSARTEATIGSCSNCGAVAPLGGRCPECVLASGTTRDPFEDVKTFSLVGTCDRPPPGWFCSRPPDHPGPCAASRVPR